MLGYFLIPKYIENITPEITDAMSKSFANKIISDDIKCEVKR